MHMHILDVTLEKNSERTARATGWGCSGGRAGAVLKVALAVHSPHPIAEWARTASVTAVDGSRSLMRSWVLVPDPVLSVYLMAGGTKIVSDRWGCMREILSRLHALRATLDVN